MDTNSYQEGFAAGFADGLHNHSKCSYTRNTEEYNNWIRGYMDGVNYHFEHSSEQIEN